MTARLVRPSVAIVLAATLGASTCGGSASPAQPEPWSDQNPQTYLQVMLDLMEANSVHRFTIDWPDFRSRVMAEAVDAETVADTFPAIRTALTLLGDGHSGYLPASGGAPIFVPTRSCTVAAVPSPSVPSEIGYVRVTQFGGTAEETLAFANAIQDAIRAADRVGLRGWIVDLRGNGGGNMWPMLAGVGPIAGEGLLGYFITPTGTKQGWSYLDGGSYASGSAAVRVNDPYDLLAPGPRVAVLIDRRVASSGEATAIAFKGRPGTRFFGTPTCGLSTANRNFPLSDSATLVLTVSVMADRTTKAYGDVVEPDEVIADPAATVARAIAWLKEGN